MSIATSRRLRSFALSAACVGALAIVPACRPTIDGAWQGTATCDADTFPISALFDEQSDEDLKGVVYIEGINVVFGEIIARGDIERGSYDAGDDSYSFKLQTDDDEIAEFSVSMDLNDKDPDELSGDIDTLDDAGATTQSCELSLDRLSVTDN